MGENGPRISTGIFGFMSQVSNWLGPPESQIWMTDVGFLVPAVGAANALVDNDSPAIPVIPACRNQRRLPTWIRQSLRGPNRREQFVRCLIACAACEESLLLA